MSDGQLAQSVLSLGLEDRQLLLGIDKATQKIASELGKTEKLAQASANRVAKAYTFSFTNIQAAWQMGSRIIGRAWDAVSELADAGSNAAETANLVSVTFGQSAGDIEAWASTTSASLVQTRLETERQAGVLFNMIKNSGLARDAALDMAKGYTQLVGDLSSFFNLRPDESFQRIQSAIAGEQEPLRRLGILIDEASIKQEAYRIGVAKTGAELNRAQKMQATYSLVINQTAVAQGDLANTQDSYANAQRQLVARYQEAKEALGSGIASNQDYNESMLSLSKTLERITEDGTLDKVANAIGHIADAASRAATGIASLINTPKGPLQEALSFALVGVGDTSMEGYLKGTKTELGGASGVEARASAASAAKATPTDTSGDVASSGIAAQETRINNLMALYQKGGEYAKEALVLEPKLLALWKAQASDIDLAAFKADQLTDKIKAQEEAAKAAAKAQQEALEKYRTVLDAFNNGSEQFRAWMDNTNKAVRTDAAKWLNDARSDGEKLVAQYEAEMGKVEDLFRDVPIWAVEAWDDADATSRRYLQSQYGVTAELESAYEGAFHDISATQQEAYDKWRSDMQEQMQLAEEAASQQEALADQWINAWNGADAGLRDMLETAWPGLNQLAAEHESTLERIIREYNKGNESAETRLGIEKKILSTAQAQREEAERARREADIAKFGSAAALGSHGFGLSQFDSSGNRVGGYSAFTTAKELERYAYEAQRLAAQGKADAAIYSLQQMIAQQQIGVGSTSPGYGSMSFGGGGWSGGRAGAISDMQALIEMIQLALQANPQQGQSGAPSGTDANPVVVKVQGGGMGTSALEGI
jgi:hypothetical protein